MGSDDPHGHDGFDRLFDGQLGRKCLFLGEKEKEPLRRDKSCGDKNRHPRLVLEIRQFVRYKSKHIIPFLWKFNKDSLTEGAFSRGREGIGELFGGSVNIFDDRDRRENTIPPADQSATQDIRGDQSDQIEQEEKANESNPREVVYTIEKRDVYIGDQGAEDTVQAVEDKLQDEERDPEGKDDQNPCEGLCSKMFKNFFRHAPAGGNSRIFFRSASSTTSLSSKRRASSPNLSFFAVSISLTLT